MTKHNSHNDHEIFIDGVGNISFVGGVIRVELVGFSSEEKDEKGNPLLTTKQHLILSPQGFVQTAGAINNLMNKMVDAGVITKKQNEEATERKKK